MANQDYVSRAPAKKKKTTRNGKKPPKNTNKSKLISLLLIVLIAAFAYGLWSLKTDPTTKSPLVEPIKTVKDKKPSNGASKKANELPKPPTEKWTYVKELETKEIEVGKYKVEEKGPYKMQCGSFRTQKQAETLKARIAFTGLEAQIQSVTGKSGNWYKVFLGPYTRKRVAEKDRHMLKRNNINYCQIWLWR